MASKTTLKRKSAVVTVKVAKEKSFRAELTNLINRFSRENESDTPDFILAKYMEDSLKSFERATRARNRWYGNGRTKPCSRIDQGFASDPDSR